MRDEHTTPFPLELERVALGEAVGTGDAEEALALEALAQSNRQILEELPVESVVQEVERRRRMAAARESTTASRPRLYLGFAMLAAAAALLFLLLRPTPRDEGTGLIAIQGKDDPYAGHGHTRSKGDPRLLIHMQTSEGSTQLEDGDEAATDDRLQLSYLAADQRYGVILSLDGRGTVTLHMPQVDGPAVLLAQDKQTLDTSYQLDDAPEFERFYFVSSDEPFAAATVVQAVRDAAKERSKDFRLALDKQFYQDVFTVRKVQP